MRVFLAHGASGTAASMRPYVAGLRLRDVEAKAVDLPKGNAERAVGVYAREVEKTGGGVFAVGGHSYGGRVASMLCAQNGDPNPAALVLLSYPLHRPGKHDDLRVEHWPRIRCPVLLLSGEADPFARIDVLRDAVHRLRHAELHTFPRVGHGLTAVLDQALDLIAAFIQRVDKSAQAVS